MNDRQEIEAVEKFRREKRLASATTADEKTLAKVETAVMASLAGLVAEEKQMRADNKYSDAYITKHMQERKLQSVAYIKNQRATLVDPIARRAESKAKADAFEMPKQDARHIEAREDYEKMTDTERDHALIKAMRGDDPVMAAALLKERKIYFSEGTLDKLRAAIAPAGPDDGKMKARIDGTLATIESGEGT